MVGSIVKTKEKITPKRLPLDNPQKYNFGSSKEKPASKRYKYATFQPTL